MGDKYGSHNTYLSKLSLKHADLLLTFKSKRLDQNEFLVDDALEYAKLYLGATYLLFRGTDDKLLAFITLGMGAIKLPENREDWLLHGRKLKEYPKQFPRQFPALKIGQLATQADEEGRGAGTYLINFAIRKSMELQQDVGCAYLVADSYPDNVDWYKKLGFRVLQEGKTTWPMYFELPY